MIEELKKLLKHSTIYGAGNILGKLVGFFMIPVYTHYLTPADYGTLELLDLSLALTTLVLTMWLNAAVVRQYNDCSGSEDQNQAVSTVLIMASLIGVVVALVGIRFSRPLAGLIVNNPDLHYFVSLEALSFLISSVNIVCLSYLRAKQRSSLVVITGLVSLFLSLLLNVYFIVVRHVGVVGILYSSLISSTIVTAVLLVNTLRRVKLTFSWDKLKGIVAFGAPLIITSAAAFTVNFSDRFFLRHFSSLAAVGVYALGYKFGFMMSLIVVQPFDMIWQARIYDIAKQDESRQVFSRLFEYYCFILVTAGLTLSVAVKELLPWIAPPAFRAAYSVVPIVVLAYAFQGANRFGLAGTYIAKKTLYLAPVGLVTALTNIGLNIVLISRYGMLGAAWSTAISFLLMAALSFAVSQRVYPIPYVFSRLMMLTGLAVFTYLAEDLLALPSFALQIAAKVGLLSLFPIVLYSSGFFSQTEVESGKSFTRALLMRFRLLSPARSE